MNGGPQELQIFNLTLYLEALEDHRFRARAIHRAPGMTAGLTFWPAREAPEDLLEQIERQYHDFSESVTWIYDGDDRHLELSWSLDQLGHVEAGEAALADQNARWATTAPLIGDQSFLPGIAMGLPQNFRSEGLLEEDRRARQVAERYLTGSVG